jgi:hypothetical protein
MQVGRNEPCPCGSGKKYKNCHAGKESENGLPRGLILLLIAIAALAALGFLPALFDRGEKASPKAVAAAPLAAPAAQPPGPAPAGKVWSKEHGHWHDANPVSAPSPITIEGSNGAAVSQSGNSVTLTEPMAQPNQAAASPAGKIWSPEHGHWHDAAKAAAKAAQKGLPPAVPPAPPRPGTIRVLGREVPINQQPTSTAPVSKN